MMAFIEEVAAQRSALSEWIGLLQGAVGGLVFFVVQRGTAAWFERRHQVFAARFAYAHSQVTATCAGVYERLFLLQRSLHATVVEIPRDEEDRLARRGRVTECVDDLRDYAGSREIFLHDSVSSAILKYLRDVTHSVQEYDLWIREKEREQKKTAEEQEKEAQNRMYAIRDLLRKNLTGHLPSEGVIADKQA